jgi:hypothetical protein
MQQSSGAVVATNVRYGGPCVVDKTADPVIARIGPLPVHR